MQIFYSALDTLKLGTTKVAVALSGGADSTALLLAAAQHFPQQVSAFHIRHGLQAMDPVFAKHCQTLCDKLTIPLICQSVNAKNQSGQSPEDAARNARYLALADLAKQQQITSVLLAQHADDQVETILLALTRGAGVAGLAAMPQEFIRHGIKFYRPFLSLSASQIRQCLSDQQISWIEDPTNQDTHYTRNKIRLHLLPPLAQYFPHYRRAFSRSARLAAQNNKLVEQLAQLDWQNIQQKMSIKALQLLAKERQANLIRYWLKTHWQVISSEAQLNELLQQIQSCTTRGHKIELKIARGIIRRQADILVYLPQT